jgi:hypothetical protein
MGIEASAVAVVVLPHKHGPGGGEWSAGPHGFETGGHHAHSVDGTWKLLKARFRLIESSKVTTSGDRGQVHRLIQVRRVDVGDEGEAGNPVGVGDKRDSPAEGAGERVRVRVIRELSPDSVFAKRVSNPANLSDQLKFNVTMVIRRAFRTGWLFRGLGLGGAISGLITFPSLLDGGHLC